MLECESEIVSLCLIHEQKQNNNEKKKRFCERSPVCHSHCCFLLFVSMVVAQNCPDHLASYCLSAAYGCGL